MIQKHVDSKSWAKTFFFVEVRGLENISFCVKNTILTAGESEQNFFFLSRSAAVFKGIVKVYGSTVTTVFFLKIEAQGRVHSIYSYL